MLHCKPSINISNRLADGCAACLRPKARLVCLDIQPNQTTQDAERADILNIGGFSDQVFEVISAFASGQLEADHWIARIEAVDV